MGGGGYSACATKLLGRKTTENDLDALFKVRVGHLRCEGVAEQNCGNYRSSFYHCGGWQLLFSKNEMRTLDIFQVASNVILVAEARSRRRA